KATGKKVAKGVKSTAAKSAKSVKSAKKKTQAKKAPASKAKAASKGVKSKSAAAVRTGKGRSGEKNTTKVKRTAASKASGPSKKIATAAPATRRKWTKTVKRAPAAPTSKASTRYSPTTPPALASSMAPHLGTSSPVVTPPVHQKTMKELVASSRFTPPATAKGKRVASLMPLTRDWGREAKLSIQNNPDGLPWVNNKVIKEGCVGKRKTS